MLLAIFIGLITTIIFLDYLIKLKKRKALENIPGPRIYPLIGSSLFLTQKNSHDAIKNIVQYMETYGSTLLVCGGNQMIVATIDPKNLEVILSSPQYITKNSLYKMFIPWLRDGLLISSGKKWHQRRKVITPSYHFKILELFVEVFDQQSRILVEKLKTHADGENFNIYPFITAAALDVITETAMQTKVNAQSDPDSAYVHAVSEMTEIVMTRMANIFYNKYDLIFRIFASNLFRRQGKLRTILHDFTRNIIQKRRISLLKEQESKDSKDLQNDGDIGIKRRMTFLDVLLQSTINDRPLNDDEIQEEVDTFMFEGHDTTTSGIAFCLYNISRNPDVQQKLYDEICQVFGGDKNDDSTITLNKLRELKYMELVIKESLRLFPPVPIIGRHVTENTEMNNRKIPAGTDIFIPIFVIHKNPEIFPDPESFIPERHSLENVVDNRLNPFVYIPFSAGPRNCIGQKFAMLEMKCTISRILKEYELLDMGDEPQVEMNIILRSMNGVQMGMRPRTLKR